jgi:hypothetical protein
MQGPKEEKCGREDPLANRERRRLLFQPRSGDKKVNGIGRFAGAPGLHSLDSLCSRDKQSKKRISNIERRIEHDEVILGGNIASAFDIPCSIFVRRADQVNGSRITDRKRIDRSPALHQRSRFRAYAVGIHGLMNLSPP